MGLLAGATINFNWIHEQQQAMVVWTVIYAWYSILPFAHPDPRDPVGGMGHGLMSADQPWSGALRCPSLSHPALGGWLDAPGGRLLQVITESCRLSTCWPTLLSSSILGASTLTARPFLRAVCLIAQGLPATICRQAWWRSSARTTKPLRWCGTTMRQQQIVQLPACLPAYVSTCLCADSVASGVGAQVVETSETEQTIDGSFTITPPSFHDSTAPLHLWETCNNSYFKPKDELLLRGAPTAAANDSMQYKATLKPMCIYTITSSSGQSAVPGPQSCSAHNELSVLRATPGYATWLSARVLLACCWQLAAMLLLLLLWLRLDNVPSAEPSPAIASKSFPFPYSDSFESYKPEATVKYFTDQGGSFNADTAPTAPTTANDKTEAIAGGMALHQVVDVRPIEWGHNPDPMTIGGDITWSDYTVSVKAMIGSKSPLPPDSSTTANNTVNHLNVVVAPPPPPTSKVQPGVTSVKLCGRIGTYSRGGSPPNGYCLIVDDEGKWYISNGALRLLLCGKRPD